MAGASVNKVILLGNLGGDPELRYTTSGKAVASFTLATTGWGGRDREPQTEWHKIVVWDKQAEQCSQYLSKGRQVYIEGRLQTRSWDDKTSGQKRYTTEIVATQVLFLSPGGQQQAGARPPARQGSSYDSPPPYGEPAGPPQGPPRSQSYGQQAPGYGYAAEPPAAEVDDIPPPSYSDDDIPF